MGTNCARLLADVFLYSYENEFLDNMTRGGHKKLARPSNFYAIETLMIRSFSISRIFGIVLVRYIHPSSLLRKLTNQIPWQAPLFHICDIKWW